MNGAMELAPGSPASPAAAKRAAIIERYGLGRIPPIPMPTPEQLKADAGVKVDAGVKRQLAPEELPEANYVRRTVGALESRLASVGSTPPHSPRGAAPAPAFPARAQSTADDDFASGSGAQDGDGWQPLPRTKSAPDPSPVEASAAVAAAAAAAAEWSRTASSRAAKSRVWPDYHPPVAAPGFQGMLPNGSPARRTVSEDPAQPDGAPSMALAEQRSAPPGTTSHHNTVDLATALAEANAWMATSRGGARGRSAGDLAAVAGGSSASPFLHPGDALDAPSDSEAEAGGGAAAQPGVSAAELQTALSMIDEDATRQSPGGAAGPVPRLQPRQLTVSGAPRKVSDAMVVSIDGAIAAAASHMIDDIRRRNAEAAAGAAAAVPPLALPAKQRDEGDEGAEDLSPLPPSARLRRRSEQLQVVLPARGYVSAPSSPRAYVAAVTRAQAEWGASDGSDSAEGASIWAGFAKPLELLPLRNCRLRPSSAPQPVWKELAAEAGITPGKPEKPDRRKKKRSPKSHAVAVTPSPELDRLGSHHESISSSGGSKDLDFSDRPPTSNPIFDNLPLDASTRRSSKDAAAKELRRKRRRAARQESLRRRYGGFSPRAFPLADISGAAHPAPEDAPDRGLDSLLRDLQGSDYSESSATDTSGASTPRSDSSSPHSADRNRPLVSSLASQRSRRSASRLSQASGTDPAASPEGPGDSAFERPAADRKPMRRLSWADEHQGPLSSDLATKEQYSSGLATCQETPGSPAASGDESPPDVGTMGPDDLAPPTPEQAPAASPLQHQQHQGHHHLDQQQQQQQQQQQWVADGLSDKVLGGAALEEATQHRLAAEAEHRRRVTEAQAAAGLARAAAQRLALERHAEEEQRAAAAAAAAGRIREAIAAERTAAAAHAAAQQAAAEAGGSGISLALLQGVALLQGGPGAPSHPLAAPPQRVSYSEIQPADDMRVPMAVDSPPRSLDVRWLQGPPTGAAATTPLPPPPPRPPQHGQPQAGWHPQQQLPPPPSPAASESGSRSSRMSFSLFGAAARGVREGFRRLSTDGGALTSQMQEAAYQGKPPAYGGEVLRSGGSASRGRRASFAASRSAHLPAPAAGAPGGGAPPAPRRSFSSGSWKGRQQHDADGDQQYESVVVRTATGDRLVVRRPVAAAPPGTADAGGAAGGLPPRSPLGGSASGRMRTAVQHAPAGAGAAGAAAEAGSSQPPGLPPRSLRTPSNGGGGGGLFRRVMSRKAQKQADGQREAAAQPMAAAV